MSPDGGLVLFDENGLADGASGGVYLRKVDGSAAVRIGDGQALSLSPDGATAITRPFSSQELRLVPTASRDRPLPGLEQAPNTSVEVEIK